MRCRIIVRRKDRTGIFAANFVLWAEHSDRLDVRTRNETQSQLNTEKIGAVVVLLKRFKFIGVLYRFQIPVATFFESDSNASY